MAWFGRLRKPGPSRIPLASNEPIERWQRRVAEAGLRLVEIKKNNQGAVYQVLAGEDPARAKDFLRKEPIDKELYYIIVETPDGNWGTDIKGLFLERLRPWQMDTANTDCQGAISGMIDMNQSIRAAARGVTDNFVVEVCCGRCGHEWIDGIRYRNLTVVRCPTCEARNLIDSDGYTFAEYDY
ncbi:MULTISPECIES: hypothetical protein [Actinomadura]|uniref:Uncharacterized protein n=1 Tax=Actinomadura yumaensis TaxID=111807 RepID=A0ABW2CCX6_9ACTN|nr:hypothetical protein [Actinomadura sp. J1-007]MWK38416.1 hypothetical protein [Actinomadura sp. J1-007]